MIEIEHLQVVKARIAEQEKGSIPKFQVFNNALLSSKIATLLLWRLKVVEVEKIRE